MSKIMRCDLHDFLEIACLFAYQVLIKLKSGHNMTGRPITTITESGQQEYLLFRVEDENKGDNETEQKIPLENLVSMKVLTQSARFNFIQFQD
jgi:Rho-binding antiterminator